MSTIETLSQSSDAELMRLLVGTWTSAHGEKTHASTVTYEADGTGREIVSFPDDKERPQVEITTEWRIEEGVLHLKSLTSSDPMRVPVGLELKDRVLSIDGERFEYAGADGYGGWEGMREHKVRVR